MDLRQVVASLLTFSMFMMLGNMIKRDHFDSIEVSFSLFFFFMITLNTCKYIPKILFFVCIVFTF